MALKSERSTHWSGNTLARVMTLTAVKWNNSVKDKRLDTTYPSLTTKCCLNFKNEISFYIHSLNTCPQDLGYQ